ncbi:MAG: competence/damage-inducible protein A [Christensenellaceae bacterium]|jgi:nicotinamide-nucleotide amidase|nr:competence/damage-inducible protein A [Christensenellaceae bacterium]
MIARIISVGTELLMGQILDTNAQYISRRLTEAGINQYLRTTVGDNHARLREAIESALAHADIVLLTGGLGPTQDDLTKETAAEALGKTLELHQPSYEALVSRFKAMGREMTPNNIKQVYFPADAIVLPNPNGTAPGCIMEQGAKAIILLPGPPREMEPMFNASVMPYLLKRSNTKLYSRTLRIFGMGESAVEANLKDIIDAQTNPTIAPYALTGETTLRVTARCESDAEGGALMQPVIDAICDRLGQVVYSTRGEALHEVCAQKLLKSGKTLAVAESCTGGLLASTLVSVPGSSQWLLEGCVSYSNASKVCRLGVQEETLARFGAVSEQTAREMAAGMLAGSGADVALATTGIAGPGGGTEQKPVGLVYVALAHAGGVQALELHLTGDRARVRDTAVLHALDMLRRFL